MSIIWENFLNKPIINYLKISDCLSLVRWGHRPGACFCRARVEVISILAPPKSIWYQLPVSCRGLCCPLVNLHWPHLHLTAKGFPGGLLADNEKYVKLVYGTYIWIWTWVSSPAQCSVTLFEDQKREKCNTKEQVKYCRNIHFQ